MTTLEFKGKKIEIITTYFNTKIDCNGGAAPWMIGTSVKTSETNVYVNGEYAFTFPFCHKKHKKNNFESKNQLNQLLSYL
jgi:hypothetical protein